MTTMYNANESCLTQKGGSSMRTTSLTGKSQRLLHLMVIVLLALGTLAPVASARILHADLGRWLRRDPLGYVDGKNLYEYVRSNPINAVDPQGLKCEGECTGLDKISRIEIYDSPTTWIVKSACCDVDNNPGLDRLLKDEIEDQVEAFVSSGCGDENCACALLMGQPPEAQELSLNLRPITFKWFCGESNGGIGRCTASINIRAKVNADVLTGVCTPTSPLPGPSFPYWDIGRWTPYVPPPWQV